MYWFKWLLQAHTGHSDTKLKDFRFRKAIYVYLCQIF